MTAFEIRHPRVLRPAWVESCHRGIDPFPSRASPPPACEINFPEVCSWSRAGAMLSEHQAALRTRSELRRSAAGFRCVRGDLALAGRRDPGLPCRYAHDTLLAGATPVHAQE